MYPGGCHREEIDNLCEVIDGHLDSMSSVRVSLGVESHHVLNLPMPAP